MRHNKRRKKNRGMAGHDRANKQNESKNSMWHSFFARMFVELLHTQTVCIRRAYIHTYMFCWAVDFSSFFPSSFQLYCYYHCSPLYHAIFAYKFIYTQNICIFLPYFIYKKYFSQIFTLRWGTETHMVRTNLAFAQDKRPTKDQKIKTKIRKKKMKKTCFRFIFRFETDKYQIETKRSDIEHITVSFQRHSNVIVNSQVHNILWVDAIFDVGLNS